jgi:glutamate synthase domain-containing protein 2
MEKIGYKVWWATIVVALALIGLGFIHPLLWWLELIFVPLALLGLWDVTQKRHSILRNYPLAGHMRFLLESMGPELHQYFVENDEDGRPFNRDQRSVVYQRAKNVDDKKPFGTELNVNAPGYSWLAHSISTRPVAKDPVGMLRTTVGGPDCAQPYSASILNISAMSFGALGASAIQAMNLGAKKGNFAHDTGEGSISPYHREHGGDLIWQLGTGYFGCRTQDGEFDPETFAERATQPQVKMIEIKVSQGAKPGHGGILPGAKVTREIADTRLVEVGKDVESPTFHRAFSTPREMTTFIAQLRELSGGKPVGFKICIGDPREFMAIVKAMVETGIHADFIVVDGGEGGTGAAPLEFSNAIGAPLLEGLTLVHNALVGAGLRDEIRIGASGKRVTAALICEALALGADWVNSARGFMFSVGCIQAQRCHTNRCPVGVTTQDPKLQRALVVSDKAERVYHFHRNTVHAVAEMIAAAGADHPSEIDADRMYKRISHTQIRRLDEIYPRINPGEFGEGSAPERFQRYWDQASADRFRPEVGAAPSASHA